MNDLSNSHMYWWWRPLDDAMPGRHGQILFSAKVAQNLDKLRRSGAGLTQLLQLTKKPETR